MIGYQRKIYEAFQEGFKHALEYELKKKEDEILEIKLKLKKHILQHKEQPYELPVSI